MCENPDYDCRELGKQMHHDIIDRVTKYPLFLGETRMAFGDLQTNRLRILEIQSISRDQLNDTYKRICVELNTLLGIQWNEFIQYLIIDTKINYPRTLYVCYGDFYNSHVTLYDIVKRVGKQIKKNISLVFQKRYKIKPHLVDGRDDTIGFHHYNQWFKFLQLKMETIDPTLPSYNNIKQIVDHLKTRCV